MTSIENGKLWNIIDNYLSVKYLSAKLKGMSMTPSLERCWTIEHERIRTHWNICYLNNEFWLRLNNSFQFIRVRVLDGCVHVVWVDCCFAIAAWTHTKTVDGCVHVVWVDSCFAIAAWTHTNTVDGCVHAVWPYELIVVLPLQREHTLTRLMFFAMLRCYILAPKKQFNPRRVEKQTKQNTLFIPNSIIYFICLIFALATIPNLENHFSIVNLKIHWHCHFSIQLSQLSTWRFIVISLLSTWRFIVISQLSIWRFIVISQLSTWRFIVGCQLLVLHDGN